MKTVGIFGSCEKESLEMRKRITDGLTKDGVEFFDCYKVGWVPIIDGPETAKHLVEDDIILYPISSTSFGFISLAEIGFVITNVFTRGANLVVMIQDLDDSTRWDVRRHPSDETRSLVKIHIDHLDQKIKDHVFLVNDVEEMISKTAELYREDKK
jgi:hypothetical protein